MATRTEAPWLLCPALSSLRWTFMPLDRRLAAQVTPRGAVFQTAQRLGITACIHSVDYPVVPVWSTCSQAVPTSPRCEFFVTRYKIPSLTLVCQVQVQLSEFQH
jgi:hypothetical protein